MIVDLGHVRAHFTSCLIRSGRPPDNDGSERDIRGAEVNMNVSHQWRSAGGTEDYCTIRSVIATAIKQARRPIDVLLGTQQIRLG